MNKDNDHTKDWDMNDIIINDLAEHIRNGGVLTDYYMYQGHTDLFEYEEKISVDTSKIGVDIIQKISK